MSRNIAFVRAASLFLVTVSVPGICHSQTPQAPGATVPLISTAYTDVIGLREAGIPLDIGAGGAAVTRDAFARGIARGLADVLSRTDPPLEKFRDRGYSATSALIRLVTEFEPELRARGVDTVAARQRFARLPVPWDHYAYQFLDRLRNAPIEIGYDDALPPSLTRQDLARQTAAFLPRSGAKSGKAPLPPDRLDMLIELVRLFESELRLMGVDAPAAMARLAKEKEGALSRGAADPMETLRRAGIFRGYPGETSRSDGRAKENGRPASKP